jgi:transposase
MARYKQPDTDQYQIVTLNFADLFPADHPTARLLTLIRSLDLSEFDANYSNDTRKGGRPAMPVDRLLAILIHSLLYGNISMRNLERDLKQRADLMFLGGGLILDHSTLSVFRRRHEDALKNLFAQVVFLGIESGMIDLETVCIDSSKIKANANARDIGTREELQRRYEYTKKLCRRRFAEWQAADSDPAHEDSKRKLRELEHRRKKLEEGLRFLEGHKDRTRVHLTDLDADWQKSGSSCIVGYAAHAAVDHSSRMIVDSTLFPDGPDHIHTVDLVERVEAIKTRAQTVETEKTKYVLDSGYASEANLEALKGRDIYMPDRAYANYYGAQQKPENRVIDPKAKPPGYEELKPLEFKYDAELDAFRCPRNDNVPLRFLRAANLKGSPYRVYGRYRCGDCPLRNKCIGSSQDMRKVIYVPGTSPPDMDVKLITPHNRTGKRPKKLKKPRTLQMRDKLDWPEGRRIYARRFPTSEGVFGTIKATRNGFQLLRRGLARVREEWLERCLAHNIGRLLALRFAAPGM